MANDGTDTGFDPTLAYLAAVRGQGVPADVRARAQMAALGLDQPSPDVQRTRDLGTTASIIGLGNSRMGQVGQQLTHDAAQQESLRQGAALKMALAGINGGTRENVSGTQAGAQAYRAIEGLLGKRYAADVGLQGKQVEAGAKVRAAGIAATASPWIGTTDGGTLNKVTGQKTFGVADDGSGGAGGGGGAGTGDKRLDSWQKEFDKQATQATSKLDPQYQTAQKLLAVPRGPGGYNLTRAESEDYAINLARLIGGSGGRVTQAQIEALVPDSAKGRFRGVQEFITNDPTGRDQQEFIRRMEALVSREMGTIEQQRHDAVARHLASHTNYAATYPNRFAAQAARWGITPDDLASVAPPRAPAHATPPATPAAPAASAPAATPASPHGAIVRRGTKGNQRIVQYADGTVLPE